jgi:biopolymer transport protein ExbB
MFLQASSQPAAQPGAVPPAGAPDAALPTGLGGNSNAAALKDMGFDHLIHNFDVVGLLVFVVLVVFSLASWYFIVANFIRNMSIRARMEKVIRTFWETPSAQESIRFMEDQGKTEPFSKIALDCASAAAHHQRREGSRLVEALNRSEFIDRALRQAVARESARLEGGLTVLATVGSTAPFVGLLGTVWGIYHALIRIGASGDASMQAVAGPVGEALIMTAFGLGVAIPAVLAYNFFVRSNRVIYARFDEFAHDLHDFFATGSRIEGNPAAAITAPRANPAPAARK